MMGKHVLLLALVVLLCALLGTAVLAQGRDAPAAPATLASYLVEAGTASGAGYQLAGGTWQVEGKAGGPGYSLEMVGQGVLQGAGCCCAYLPYLSRDQ